MSTSAPVTITMAIRSNAQQVKSKSGLVHPGLLNTMDELKIIKKNINSKSGPMYAGYRKMVSSKVSSLGYSSKPYATAKEDFNGTNKSGSDQMQMAALSTYSHAIQWWVTGNKAHAEKAITIMRDWSKTLKNITGKNAHTASRNSGVARYVHIAPAYPGWRIQR